MHHRKVVLQFTSAYFFAAISLSSNGAFNFAREAMLKADEGKEKLPEKMQVWLDAFKAQYLQKNHLGTRTLRVT